MTTSVHVNRSCMTAAGIVPGYQCGGILVLTLPRGGGREGGREEEREGGRKRGREGGREGGRIGEGEEAQEKGKRGV